MQVIETAPSPTVWLLSPQSQLLAKGQHVIMHFQHADGFFFSVDHLTFGRIQTRSGLSAFQRATAIQPLRAGGPGTGLRLRAPRCIPMRWRQTLPSSPSVEGPESASGTSLHFWRRLLPFQCCSGEACHPLLPCCFNPFRKPCGLGTLGSAFMCSSNETDREDMLPWT